MKCVKHIILLFVMFVGSISVSSQIIDTCQTNETAVYHVLNKSVGSQLFFQAENAEIISENPTFADSVMIKWNSQKGTFNLLVYEITEFECTGETYTAQILVEEPNNNDLEIDIPNVFTPNNDNKNDYFTITAKEQITNYEIKIYNRWGRKVFETNDINYSWDGRTQGIYCSTGVYYYVITYHNNGRPQTKNGFLHLYR